MKTVSFSLLGNNLWIINKNLPDADPEAGTSSGNIQGFQSGVMPTTKYTRLMLKLPSKMKKLIYSITAMSLFMTSCVSDDPTINNDLDKSYAVPAETLFTNAEKELTDQLTTPSVNLNVIRYFTQY